MNHHIKTLSHVGIPTSNLEASLKWYTEVLGFEEAFRLEHEGRTLLIYLHVSPTTFVELFPPRADGSVPHTHFSLEVEDVEAAVADLKKRLPPESTGKPEIITGMDGSRIFNFFDPDGHRIEFQQFIPDSQQSRAMARLRS